MTLFVILRNADFTEGRGPMVLHGVFTSKESVTEYLNTITYGVYGFKPEKGKTFAETVFSRKHGGWAGYEVKEVMANEPCEKFRS